MTAFPIRFIIILQKAIPHVLLQNIGCIKNTNTKGEKMDISAEIAELKKRPDFRDNVGMILTHNGVVRNWSRSKKGEIISLEVLSNVDKIEELRPEYLKKEGIYEILIEPHSGNFQPGDDLLFIVVAGDIRENIKPVLADLLDRVKSEAISKREIFA